MKRIVCLICALSLAGIVLGQGVPGGVSPASIDPLTGLPVGQSPKPNEPRFSIDFPGGDPRDLIREIEKASKTRPNVVIHPECTAVNVPQFRLQDVSVSQIFNTLNSLAEPEFQQGAWRQVPLVDGEVWTLTKHNPGAFAGRFGGMGMGMGIPAQPSPPPQPRACKIFNLHSYLETFTVEDITTAIQGAWDLLMSETNPPPNLKYHKDTKLLIVVGTTPDLNVVADVLQQLNSTVLYNQHNPVPGKAPKPEPQAPKQPTNP